MKISLVLAADIEGGIGKAGKLLWRDSRDMSRFVELTMGKPVLMGRKTYESIPPKFRPLNGRTNIVVTRQSLEFPGCIVVNDLVSGIMQAQLNGAEELMIAGGGEIYRQALPFADQIYMTLIEAKLGGDTFFALPDSHNWIESNKETYEDAAGNLFHFYEMRRRTPRAYDSTAETLKHIKKVSTYLNQAATELIHRGNVHDDSKLVDPEKALFDLMTPMLATLKYGSAEYSESVAALRPALEHHYANNSHHPEHFSNGVSGMTLFDLVEMFYDWKAATERTADGNISKSILINAERFKLSPQIVEIFQNTVKHHGW